MKRSIYGSLAHSFNVSTTTTIYEILNTNNGDSSIIGIMNPLLIHTPMLMFKNTAAQPVIPLLSGVDL